MFLGRLNSRVYVAFAPLIVLGTIEAASIPVVGFNAVLMSEHFGAFFAFLVLHAAMGIKYIKARHGQGLLPEYTGLRGALREHIVVMVHTANIVTCTRGTACATSQLGLVLLPHLSGLQPWPQAAADKAKLRPPACSGRQPATWRVNHKDADWG